MNGIQARFRLPLGRFVLDASFQAPGRGITALFGPSGSGKTTLLRLIAGLAQGEGRLEVNGTLWQDSDRKFWVPTHQRALGYVFQEASLFPHLSVRGNLEYGFRRTPAAERRLTFHAVVDLLGLEPMFAHGPADLSGGERQRVAIARALLTSPRLLLMDEPISALDEANKQEILPYLERLHDELEIPVIYVSHAFKEVARLADYMVLMGEGRVRGEGPLASVMTRLDLAIFPEEERVTVIEATVAEHDEEYHLTTLRFPGGSLRVARQPLPPGHSVRVQIPAADVSLTLGRDEQTSILNTFPAQIQAIVPAGPAQLWVRLSIGAGNGGETGTVLLARITRKSGDLLRLKPGMAVFAQVKSVALMRAQ